VSINLKVPDFAKQQQQHQQQGVEKRGKGRYRMQTFKTARKQVEYIRRLEAQPPTDESIWELRSTQNSLLSEQLASRREQLRQGAHAITLWLAWHLFVTLVFSIGLMQAMDRLWDHRCVPLMSAAETRA
jgi:hypothetical protein